MLKETLRKVAITLDKLHVPFALIGGMAVAARGAFRTTKDVDFLIDWPLHEAVKLAQSLSENGLPSTFRKGLGDDPVVGVIRTSVPTSASICNCDILFPTKKWQLQAVPRATRVDMGGFILPVVQADDLFLLKLYAGGPQDLLDAAQLLKLQNEDERRAWKESAAKIGRSRMFTSCLKFLQGDQ